MCRDNNNFEGWLSADRLCRLQAAADVGIWQSHMRLGVPRGTTIDFNRMAFMQTDGMLASVYVPVNRAQEIRGGNEGRPSDGREAQFAEGSEGRVVIIETSESEG